MLTKVYISCKEIW